MTSPLFQGPDNTYRGVGHTLPPLTSSTHNLSNGRQVVLSEQQVPYEAAQHILRVLRESSLHLSNLEIDRCAINCPTLNLLIHNSCSTLNQLTLDGDYCLHDLEHCVELTELTICNSSILDPALIPVLENNPYIQHLDLHNCIDLDSSFDAIVDLEKVVKLNLSATYVDDLQLKKILEKHGTTLTHLDLSTCPALTRHTLTLILRHCTKLQELYLHFNPDIIEEGEPFSTNSDTRVFLRIKRMNPDLRIISHGFINDNDLNTSLEIPIPHS